MLLALAPAAALAGPRGAGPAVLQSAGRPMGSMPGAGRMVDQGRFDVGRNSSVSNGRNAIDRDFGRDRAEDRAHNRPFADVSNGRHGLDRDRGRDRAEDRAHRHHHRRHHHLA